MISDKPSQLVEVTRTLEFPVKLTSQQKETLENWLTYLTKVWNISLKRLEEFDEVTGYYCKETKEYNPVSPINWEYRNIYLDENGLILWGKELKEARKRNQEIEKIQVPFTRIISEATVKPRGSTPYLKNLKQPRLFSGERGNAKVLSHRGEPNTVLTTGDLASIQGVISENGCSGFSCPIRPSCGEITRNAEPLPYEDPLIRNAKYNGKGGLGQAIKGENLAYHPAFEEITSVPYKFRSGVIYGLSVSWQEYDKSRRKVSAHGIYRGKPQYKSQRDRVKTIVHPNPKGVIVPLDGDKLRGIPTIGTVTVKGLNKRWQDFDGSYPQVAMFKFCQRPNGWTVQLTGKFHVNPKLRRSKGAIACDAGLQHALIFDTGKFIDNPRWYRQAKDKLAKIQRQLQHKRTHRLLLWLNHPERTPEDIKAVVNVAKDDAIALTSVKSEKDGVALIGGKRWQRLKYKCLPDSSAIKELEKRLKIQHRKIAQKRKSFWDRLSSWVVRNYEIFICENGLQDQKLRGKSEPKYENGKAVPNQKKAKSGLNLSLSDLAPGYFMAECERKAKEWGRTFIRYPAKSSTLKCPICETENHIGANYLGQEYVCSCCGYRENRDKKAAIYIAVHGWESKKIPFDLLSEASKDAVLARIEYQEAQKPKRKKRKKKSANGVLCNAD